MTWTEVDSAVTQPAESDIAFGPIGTQTSLQGLVVTQLDNLPSQHPHYALIPNYLNQAKDEILTLGLQMNRNVLDQCPRLRNWRWWDVTLAGQGWMPLPERMLYLEAMSYSQSTAAFDPSTTKLYPATLIPEGAATDFGLYDRTTMDWPRLWRRAGSHIELWPVPASSPTDYRTAIVVYGTRMDNNLVNPTDTLLMSPRMQLLTVDLGVAICMEKMGWEEAADRRASVESKLGRLIGMGTKERVKARVTTRVAGTP